MKFEIQVEISPSSIQHESAVREVLRSDPVLQLVLSRAEEGQGRLPDERVFFVHDTDRELLQLFLRRLWGYCHVRGVLVFSVLPKHTFAAEELEDAEYLLMRVEDWCETFGDYHNTRYDRQRYCPDCGAGATVLEDLRCPRRHVSWLRTGFAKLSDNELVATRDLLSVCLDAGIEGIRLLPVVDPEAGSPGAIEGVWHVRCESECGPIPAGNLVLPSERCRRYCREAPHRPGFWLLSQLRLRRGQLAGDIFATRDHFGQFMGKILPGPLVVVSQRVYHLLVNNGVTGVSFEPVMVLDELDDGFPCGHEFENLGETPAELDLIY